jgi:hypothetical protein
MVLHDNLSWAEACEWERHYIKEFQTRDRQNGYNLTDGGDGVVGMVQSEKGRQAARFNQIKCAEAHRGVKLTGAHLEKVRSAQTKGADILRGKTLTGMRLKQVRIAQLKAVKTCRGKLNPRISELNRQRWQNLEYRAIMLEAQVRGRETRTRRAEVRGVYEPQSVC